MLKETFHTFVATLHECRVPAAQGFMPGRRPDAVRSRTRSEGLELRQETVDWFTLVDGVNQRALEPGTFCMFAPGFESMSLDQSLLFWLWLRETHEGPDASVVELPGIEQFVPLSNHPSFYCAVQAEGDVSSVHLYSPEEAAETYNVERFSSIESMVLTWIEGWRTGRFVARSNGAVFLEKR